MRYCTNCGAPCEETAKFCIQCGSPVTPVENVTPAAVPIVEEPVHTENNSAPNYNHRAIAERSIPVALILSIVTCGLYSIYWMIMLNDEVNSLANEPDAPSGGIVFLLTIVTCGFYSIYWLYKMGERCDRIKGVNGNSGIIYLILGLFGVGIISYCLMQDTINKAI